MVGPHGKHVRVDPRKPRAKARCDKCGLWYMHSDLRMAQQWVGPRIQTLGSLLCPTCWDVPQQQLRTIVLPPDPVPIRNARPENFVACDNPISGIGFDPATMRSVVSEAGNGMFIGSLLGGGGLVSAFDNITNKPSWMCARSAPSASGLNNYIGCNWNAGPGSGSTPSVLPTPVVQSYSISEVLIYAPNDQPFLSGSSAVAAAFQGSNDGTSWINLWSGTTAGSIGETLTLNGSVNLVESNYPYHRFVLNGDGVGTAAIAQITMTSLGLSYGQDAGVET